MVSAHAEKMRNTTWIQEEITIPTPISYRPIRENKSLSNLMISQLEKMKMKKSRKALKIWHHKLKILPLIKKWKINLFNRRCFNKTSFHTKERKFPQWNLSQFKPKTKRVMEITSLEARWFSRQLLEIWDSFTQLTSILKLISRPGWEILVAIFFSANV